MSKSEQIKDFLIHKYWPAESNVLHIINHQYLVVTALAWIGVKVSWASWYLQVPNPAGKLNQHLHIAYQQRKTWTQKNSWFCDAVNKHHQHTKSSLIVETPHWSSSNLDFVPLYSSIKLLDPDFFLISPSCSSHHGYVWVQTFLHS